MRSLTTNKGFTLIEVLLSVFISVLVISVIFSSYFQIVRSKQFTENQLDMLQEARMIMMSLTRDLTMAYPRGKIFLETGASDEPFFVGEMEGGNSTLKFTTLSLDAGLKTNSSDQVQVSYFVERGPEGDYLQLLRRENAAIGMDEEGLQYSVSERLVSFTVEFVSSNDEDAVSDEWDSGQSDSLPRAVNIQLVLGDDRGEEFEFNSLVIIPAAN